MQDQLTGGIAVNCRTLIVIAPVARAETEGFQTLTWDASPAVTGQRLAFRFGASYCVA